MVGPQRMTSGLRLAPKVLEDQQVKVGPGWEGKVAVPWHSEVGNSPASVTMLPRMGCQALLGLGSSAQLIPL